MPIGLIRNCDLTLKVKICRLNGLTGQKMQKIFKALVTESVYNDARNLVEYCCFRFLSRDSSDIHPSLKVCDTYSREISLMIGSYRLKF